MNRREFVLHNFLLLTSFKTMKESVLFDFLTDRPPLLSKKPRIKSFVFLFMSGGPSQIELFDYKTDLYKKDGQTIDNFTSEKGQVGGKIMKPISHFKQYGEADLWFSNLVPHLAMHADDLLFLKGVQSNSQNHLLAQTDMMTGSIIPHERPHLGSWISYALKRKSNFPDCFIFTDILGLPTAGEACWNHGEIPSLMSQIVFESTSTLEIQEKLEKMSLASKEDEAIFLHYLKETNEKSRFYKEKELRNRSYLFELVFSTKDQLLTILKNIKYGTYHKKLYGVDRPGVNTYADQLILTKELLKQGIPYIQIINGANNDEDKSWDHHFKIDHIVKRAKSIDMPTAGFLQDLKNDNMEKETLVMWGGEFGRTPIIDEVDVERVKVSRGRNHNHLANTVWLFGEGVKKGFSYGETDNLSLETIKNAVTFGDIWSTVLHLLGINHEELYFKKGEKKISLTKSKDSIISDIIA